MPARKHRKPPLYQLEVATTIKRSDLHIIYRMGPKLIELIEGDDGKGHKLVELKRSGSVITDDRVTIINYWDLKGDANVALELEQKIPDEPEYAQFDRLILEEQRHIMLLSENLPDVTRNPLLKTIDPSSVYLRAVYSVSSPNLNEFWAVMEEVVVPAAVENGWCLGEAQMALTGRANDIVQLWIVPEASVPLVGQRLAALRFQELVDREVDVQILEPTPSDPLIGARRRGRAQDRIDKAKEEHSESIGN